MVVSVISLNETITKINQEIENSTYSGGEYIQAWLELHEIDFVEFKTLHYERIQTISTDHYMVDLLSVLSTMFQIGYEHAINQQHSTIQ